MSKQILLTPTQFYPVTGTITGQPKPDVQRQPSVQAKGASAITSPSPQFGVVAVILWLLVMRLAWEYGARL